MASRIRAFLLGGGGRKAVIDEEQWARSGQTVLGGSMATQLILSEGIARDYLTIYETFPSVRQVVDFQARSLAQVPIKEYDRQGDADRTHVEDSAFEALLRDPNPEMTYFEFMRDLATDLGIYDVTYWGKVRAGGKVAALVRLNPSRISFEGGDALAPEKFIETHADGTKTEWARRDVFWVHGFGSRRGISPMETLRSLLAEEDASQKGRTALFKNGMRNAGVIERPADAPDWSDRARKNFLDSLADRYTGGANAGRPLVLEEGMTWKSDQVNLSASQVLSDREVADRMVARLYGYAPEVLGLEPSPYGSIQDYNAAVYQNALAPKLAFLEQRFRKDLLVDLQAPGSQTYVEFSLEAKLRGSFESQAALLTAAVGGPYMTPNEARAKFNLPALEGGDELLQGGGGVQPADMGSGGSQSPADAPVDQTPQEAPKMAQKAGGRPERGLLRRRAQYAKDLEDVVTAAFDRMVARTEKSGGFKAATVEAELQKDVRPTMERIVTAEASRKATQLGGEFDPKRVQHYLDKGADLFSKNVVKAGAEALDRPKEELDQAKVALAAIAARVALGQATHLSSFGREEGGRQAGASKKTWVVTSDNSRHPELDGETVGMGKTFSNGLGYPGDPSGDPDETAGCACILDLS